MTQPLQVKIKRLNKNAVIPTYAKTGDAGMDLVAVSVSGSKYQVSYGTGIAVKIPVGYVGLIFPRSSIRNKDLSLSNAVGVIDSGYRGEISVTFNRTFGASDYEIGDKIVQMIIMPYPQIEFEVVDELSTTERGNGGFGHTGA